MKGKVCSLLLFCLACSAFARSNVDLLKSQLRFPNDDHFRIEVFADSPGNGSTWFPRSMLLTPRGTIFVASYGFGGISGTNPALTQVYAIVPSQDWSKPQKIVAVTPPLWVPNGIGFHNGSLYVAQINKLWKFPDIEDHLDNVTFEGVEIKEVSEFLPNHTWHGWRYIKFSPAPEEKLYFAIGSPCNVPCNDDCNCTGEPFGTIMRFNPRNWTERDVYAKGIRNSVGFDWHPTTQEFWFTDNGRDAMDPDHNDRPPDELNRVTEPGKHYGFPFCYGKELVDHEFYNGSCSNSSLFVGAAQELGPHVAALGLRFYTGDMFPEEFKNSIFIAEHGSWDRQPPTGYRITLVKLGENGTPLSYNSFLEGWLTVQTCQNDTDCPYSAPCQPSPTRPFYCGGWGRPADVEILPDGSILVSDEVAGIVWRVTYEAPTESSSLYWLIPALCLIVIVAIVALSEVVGKIKTASSYHRIES